MLWGAEASYAKVFSDNAWNGTRDAQHAYASIDATDIHDIRSQLRLILAAFQTYAAGASKVAQSAQFATLIICIVNERGPSE